MQIFLNIDEAKSMASLSPQSQRIKVPLSCQSQMQFESEQAKSPINMTLSFSQQMEEIESSEV